MMRRSIALLALAVVAACDYPTEPPRWEQTWVVPGESIDLSVAEILPAGIDLNADTTAFVVEAPRTSLTFSLAEMCGTACAGLDGVSGVPKPAFQHTLATTTSLPADLVSASLVGGSFELVLAHDFNFDPLRPSSDPGSERGFLALAVTSNGNVVARDTVRGEDTAFPAGVTLSPALAIRPVDVTRDLRLEVTVYSPEGDATTIETSDELTVSLERSPILAAEATVAIPSITLDPTTTTMDFAGIEEDGIVLDQVRSGAIRFDVHNPFAVAGTADVAFELPTGTIQRSLAIREGDYQERAEFTGDEIRRILAGDVVEVVATGSVAATDGTVTVTPDQELVLDNAFELVLLVGGTEE